MMVNKTTSQDREFAATLAQVLRQPKFGYGPVIAITDVNGCATRFVRQDPANDYWQALATPDFEE